MPKFRRPLGLAPHKRLVLRGHLLSFGLAASASVALTVTTNASALPLLQLSGNARWLYSGNLRDEDSDLSSPGFGLSAGVTLPLSLYLGASFQYFVGTDHSYTHVDPSGAVVSREEFSNSSFQLLAHLGYDIGLLALTLRPSLGFGWWRSAYWGKCEAGCDPTFNRDGVALSPGVELLYSFGLLNVSGEARFDTIAFSTGGSTQSLIVGLGAGFSL